MVLKKTQISNNIVCNPKKFYLKTNETVAKSGNNQVGDEGMDPITGVHIHQKYNT